MTVISRMEGKTGIGECILDSTTPKAIYEEIRDLMFDAPNLTNVEMLTFEELLDFIEGNAPVLKIGHSIDHFGKCVFELYR